MKNISISAVYCALHNVWAEVITHEGRQCTMASSVSYSAARYMYIHVLLLNEPGVHACLSAP